MCGRYHLTASAHELADLFGLPEPPSAFGPSFNISPTQQVPVVRSHPHRGPQLHHLRWGLLPHWMENPLDGPLMINARQETAHQKPAFRGAFERRRCLLPATGFYEWQRVGTSRVPYSVTLADPQTFAFAGLWERWQPAGQMPIESVVILTTAANDSLASIHDRMPVMLSAEAFESWLSPRVQSRSTLAQILHQGPGSDFDTTRVSDRVNNSAHNDADCLTPTRSPGPLFPNP